MLPWYIRGKVNVILLPWYICGKFDVILLPWYRRGPLSWGKARNRRQHSGTWFNFKIQKNKKKLLKVKIENFSKLKIRKKSNQVLYFQYWNLFKNSVSAQDFTFSVQCQRCNMNNSKFDFSFIFNSLLASVFHFH